MHPFGGTQICPRCGKAVYAAEQVMGPGRKLYHKPCLACTQCSKRLDSFTLLEHDQMPYCKPCHTRSFGTRDLRQANLPHRDTPGSSTQPAETTDDITERTATPHLRPRSLSPIRTDRTTAQTKHGGNTDGNAERHPSPPLSPSSSVTNTGRSATGFPRTVLLSPTRTMGRSSTTSAVELRASESKDPNAQPPFQTATGTGTRYGTALSGDVARSPSPVRKWGGTTPICPRCGKSVYFAEQVKAVGKTYHKGCLRCTECSTLLDSSRLTEKDGSPLCHRCYSKLHGPQGSGYALLGKAGS